MYIFVIILILIICVLLALVVLVQNSKGGGLAANFAGSNQIMGARKTADFLEKTTWYLAIALVTLSLVSAFIIPRPKTGEGVKTEVTVDESKIPAPASMRQNPQQQQQQQAQPAQGEPAAQPQPKQAE